MTNTRRIAGITRTVVLAAFAPVTLAGLIALAAVALDIDTPTDAQLVAAGASTPVIASLIALSATALGIDSATDTQLVAAGTGAAVITSLIALSYVTFKGSRDQFFSILVGTYGCLIGFAAIALLWPHIAPHQIAEQIKNGLNIPRMVFAVIAIGFIASLGAMFFATASTKERFNRTIGLSSCFLVAFFVTLIFGPALG